MSIAVLPFLKPQETTQSKVSAKSPGDWKLTDILKRIERRVEWGESMPLWISGYSCQGVHD